MVRGLIHQLLSKTKRQFPKWTIGGPDGVLEMPRGVALDVKNQSIIVSDKRLNSVLTFRVPELFETGDPLN
jgi:hypothetical protein